jgi:tetratricopeptide (TPR) repeat protein
MKSKLLLIVMFVLSIGVNAQDKGKDSKDKNPKKDATMEVKPSNELELKIYTTALKYGDVEVARTAMYSLLAKHPDSICYLDTIARLYFSAGNYVQCALSSKDYLAKDSSNLFIREMLAISYSSLNKSKESLDQYEILYATTKSVYHAYQIAILQYMLKRLGECEATLAEIIANPKSATEKVSMNVDQNSTQQVPLKAAAYNIKGVMQKEMNKPDEAKIFFEEALKIYPDFALAKANIEALNKPKTPEKK